MLGLVGVGTFWLAGEFLLGRELLAGVHWLLITGVAVCCGVLAWHGDYDTWADRMLHFVALLLLCAAYVALWDDVLALMTSDWQRAIWFAAGVAMPLMMSLGGPVRGVLVKADDDDD